MVTCELDPTISGEALGWRLPVWQSIVLHRLLPSCAGLVIYMLLMATDIALVVEQRNDGNPKWAAMTAFLCFLPALAGLMFTLATPPPGLLPDQDPQSAWSFSIDRGDGWWVVLQFVNTVAFPVATIGRYCHQIFWSMEAACAAHEAQQARCVDALGRVRAPSPLELYLFLQAFVHAAPHAILQLYIVFNGENAPNMNTVSLQVMSIVTSLLRMASVATVYRRFEREKITGRRYPWAREAEADAVRDSSQEEKTPLQEIAKSDFQQTISISNEVEVFESQRNSPDIEDNLDQIEYRKPHNKSFSIITRTRIMSSDSDYLQPIASKSDSPTTNNETGEELFEESVEFRQRVDDIGFVRGSSRFYTGYNIVDMSQEITPPSQDAPRIGSVAVWAGKFIENAENLAQKVPRRRMHSDPPGHETDLPMPVRTIKPKTYIRGLEPQDGVAAIVAYVAWFFFFISRLFSLAAFTHFFPATGITIIFVHYTVMLLLLVIPQASTLRRAFYVFLAFVYVFCLLEFKVRFTHVRTWHAFWMILCTFETLILMSVWVISDFTMDSWWQSYMVAVIGGSAILSYMCLMVFFLILKPKEKIVYISENKT